MRFLKHLKEYLREKLKKLLINEFLQPDKLSDTKEYNVLVNEIKGLKNQHNERIHQLFSYIGDLNLFVADTLEEIKETNIKTQINQAYFIQSAIRHKKVVYTCLTGNYDNLPLHSYLDFDFDYVCFTDSQILLKMKRYGAWQIRPLVYSKLDNTKNNRWHKLHPHLLFPEYEESIYIDSNITIKNDWIFTFLSEKKLTNNILVPIHYERNSIYEDIEFVVNILHKETRENADKVIEFLKKENFPHNYGLTENNLIYRKHNDPEIISIMNDWWYFIENYSKRDQFSFTYVLYKHGIKPSEISIPNLRPLYNSFRIDANHNQQSAFREPSELPEYEINNTEVHFVVETAESYGAYVRRAGFVVLDDDFDVYIRANRYYYKADKILRPDVTNNYSLSRKDVGFDVRISFYDAAEGKLQLCIVNHTKEKINIFDI